MKKMLFLVFLISFYAIEISSQNLQFDSTNIVVVGYGTALRSTVTGSVATVNTEQVKTFAASTNIVDAMSSSIAGAFVVAQGGRPGELSNIYLRGPVSITGRNPLYVVDGVPMDNMDYRFNLDDIESISVLKDASAAAIYGGKAASGVILVNTKRGTNAPLRVRATSSFGIRNALYLPEVLNRDDYLRAREIFGTNVTDLYGPKEGWSKLPNTNWFDEIFRTGKEQNYGISLTGGNNVSSYFLSGGFNRVDGVSITNYIQRFTLRINTDHQITKRLKFNQGLYFTNGKENPTNNMYAIFRQIPMMAVYDPTATDNRGFAKVITGFYGNNRVQQIVDRKVVNKNNYFNLNGTLSYDIIEGLKASVFGAATMAFGDNYLYTWPVKDGVYINPETVRQEKDKREDYIMTFSLNYNKRIGLHSISFLTGYETRKIQTSYVVYAGNGAGGFANPEILNRFLSQFGRLVYMYDDKYIFTGNIRRDGYSSKFGPEYNYGVFPGGSIGWNISREDFFNVPAVHLLKLRVGYGILGSALGYDFNYAVTGLQSVKWETVATTNLGVDGILWQGRLAFNIDYYSRQTRDMLYDIPVPRSAGAGGNVQANVGQMSNKGVELQFEYKNNITSEIGLSLGINLGHNKNKLISLSDEIDRLYITAGSTTQGGESGGVGMQGTPIRSDPGQPLGQFWGLKTAGIYKTDEEAKAGPTYNIRAIAHTPRAGDLKYVDLNNDGRITTADYTYIGNTWPKLTYGFTVGADWKKMIDIRAIFGGTYGNDILNCVATFQHQFFADYTSSPMIFDVSFFGENGLTDKPRNGYISNNTKGGWDNNGNWTQISDYHVKDGSYIQLKTLQIGFSLPKNYTSRLGVSNARFTLSGNNLFILTKYDGLNPIVPPQDRNILAQGIETASGRYPLSRLLSVGLNIDF